LCLLPRGSVNVRLGIKRSGFELRCPPIWKNIRRWKSRQNLNYLLKSYLSVLKQCELDEALSVNRWDRC
jgi:hypothetical protein